MSAARNDGGPAFPVPEHMDHWGKTHTTAPGMTLRDYFAVHCLPISKSTFPDGLDGGWAALAAHAYSIADAMLKARQQQEGGAA